MDHCDTLEKTPSYLEDAPYKYYSYDLVFNENDSPKYGLIYLGNYNKDSFHIFLAEGQVSDAINELLKFMKAFMDMFRLEYVVEIRHSQYIVGKPIDEWYVRELMHYTHQFCRGECGMSKFRTFKMLHEKASFHLSNNIKKLRFKNVRFGYTGGRDYGIGVRFRVKDIKGNEFSLSSFDIDMVTCYKMGIKLCYKENPAYEFERTYLIHGSISNSLERLIGTLLEHYKGDLPFMLTPWKICFVHKKSKELSEELQDILSKSVSINWKPGDGINIKEEEDCEDIPNERKVEICEGLKKYKAIVFVEGDKLKTGRKFEVWIGKRKMKNVSFEELEGLFDTTMGLRMNNEIKI
eukprot:GAHX01004645.1.p2 GENE.GAHX01004645.1~~GAHX01004645.1.p2  ORF type:complete len:350 (+),score=54.67 GAHX01004645.1:1327-2376(+)